METGAEQRPGGRGRVDRGDLVPEGAGLAHVALANRHLPLGLREVYVERERCAIRADQVERLGVKLPRGLAVAPLGGLRAPGGNQSHEHGGEPGVLGRGLREVADDRLRLVVGPLLAIDLGQDAFHGRGGVGRGRPLDVCDGVLVFEDLENLILGLDQLDALWGLGKSFVEGRQGALRGRVLGLGEVLGGGKHQVEV